MEITLAPIEDADGGSDGSDFLMGGEGDDYIAGDGGDDEIWGSFVFGPSGNDFLDGGFGTDTLIGLDGNDGLYGGFGSSSGDSVYGGDGDDVVSSGTTILPTVPDDNVFVGWLSEPDFLDGGADVDIAIADSTDTVVSVP